MNTVWNCNIITWHWLPLREGSVYLLAVPMSPKCGSHIHLKLGRAVFAVNTVVSLLPHTVERGNFQKEAGKVRIYPPSTDSLYLARTHCQLQSYKKGWP